MAEVSIKIVVDDDHLDATESIARTIGEHGLRIDRVVPEAGAIRAFGEESDLDALRKIDGVLEVTRERTYKLPPMNDKIRNRELARTDGASAPTRSRTVTAATRIIIDTDPGQDDAVAILLALASPEIEVLGITAVAGNVPLALTTANALKICELAGRADLAVHAGAAGPLVRALVTAEAVHGKSGLDGPDLPAPAMRLRDGHAADFIVQTLRQQAPGTVTLCAMGPLTNIALAFARAPDVVGRVARIVAMGGGWSEGGNATPVAEFNIYVDPQAAQAVFDAGVPVVLMPLDVTHKCLTRADRVAAFRALGTRVGAVVADLIDFFERFDERKYGTDGAPLHDPNVIAWLLEPELYGGRDVNLEVETGSELTMGQTVVDWWAVTGRPTNVHFVRQVDDDAFFRLLLERIGRL